MPAKKTFSVFTRQLKAASTARKEKRWEAAIANYTRALAHKNLPVDVRVELLEGRAACFKKTGDLKARAADLENLSALLKSKNEDLSSETAQRTAELAVIASVQDALAKELDLKGIYRAVGQKILEIFKTQSVTIRSFDVEKGIAYFDYILEKGKELNIPPGRISGAAKYILDLDRSVLINENVQQFLNKHRSRIQAGEMPKSFMAVPYKKKGPLRGGITIENMERENAFTQSDVRLMEAIANSMAAALDNAQLFDEIQTRNREISENLEQQTATSEILEVIASSPEDIDKVLLTIAEKAAILSESDASIAYVEEGVLKLRAHYGSIPFWEIGEGVKFNRQSVAGVAILDGKPNQAIHNVKGQVSKYPVADKTSKRFGYAMTFAVPLMTRGQASGVIIVRRTEARLLNDREIALMQSFANQAAIAIEKARLLGETNRLLEETSQRNAELAVINSVQEAMAKQADIEGIYEAVGEKIKDIFDAQSIGLDLFDETSRLIVPQYSFENGKRLFSNPVPYVDFVDEFISAQKTLVINQNLAETLGKARDYAPDPSWGESAKSGVWVPLIAGNKVIGDITLQNLDRENAFSPSDVRLLETIAASMSVAVENARLFAEVARQKKYFETFFQYSPAAVVVVNFDGNVISWNPAAETLFGYSAEEAIGHNVDDLVANNPEIQAEARSYTKQATDELGRIEVIGRRTRKDGSFVDVEVKALPISVEGTMLGLLVIYHDISEIESARRAAEEANQAKSAFLANMSHELRTPLNAIIGFTRIVRRKGEEALPEKQIDNLDKVLVSAEHLLGLINTILDIAKIEAGRMEVQLSNFDLSALVDSCLATTQPLLKSAQIKLLKSLPHDLPQMHSDQEKIRQILLNLLSNAAKFTHEGSIQVVGEMKEKTVVISVKDTGIGIAPENLNKIFEEFQQADNTTTRQYGGTGLGLSISRSLAHLLGGDLTASSVEGEGSIFSLTLPLQPSTVGSDKGAGSKELSEDASTLEPDKPVILVIDDQPDMFHILQQTLDGYQVVGALNGEEGIEKARALQPAAITLDIMMPQKDGWQVLYELKSDPQTKDIPVVMLTIVDNKAMGFRLGASDYLMKPLSEKLILEALERVTKANGGVQPRRLLVVDDDPKVFDLIQQMFQGKEFSVEAAEDGAKALDIIEQNQPDVVLLDLIMPKMDGFQFIDEIQGRPMLSNMPIIVLTAKTLSNEETIQLQKSVRKILQKQGLGSDELIAEIHKVVA